MRSVCEIRKVEWSPVHYSEEVDGQMEGARWVPACPCFCSHTFLIPINGHPQPITRHLTVGHRGGNYTETKAMAFREPSCASPLQSHFWDQVERSLILSPPTRTSLPQFFSYLRKGQFLLKKKKKTLNPKTPTMVLLLCLKLVSWME